MKSPLSWSNSDGRRALFDIDFLVESSERGRKNLIGNYYLEKINFEDLIMLWQNARFRLLARAHPFHDLVATIHHTRPWELGFGGTLHAAYLPNHTTPRGCLTHVRKQHAIDFPFSCVWWRTGRLSLGFGFHHHLPRRCGRAGFWRPRSFLFLSPPLPPNFPT